MGSMSKDYVTYATNIKKFWDKNAHERHDDIKSGNDKTYVEIITPSIVDMIKREFKSNISILDAGCGSGYLTNEISKHYCNITGIDISEIFISIARNEYPNLTFHNKDIYDIDFEEKYDLCLATMVIHNLPCLTVFLKKIFSALKKDGFLLVTTLHPSFWPRERIKNFDYSENEREYQVPLRGRSDRTYSSLLSYFHRTLNAYYDIDGFQVLAFEELYGYEDDSERRKKNKNPNILVVLLQKINTNTQIKPLKNEGFNSVKKALRRILKHRSE